MRGSLADRSGAGGSELRAQPGRAYRQPIDTQEIFRQLIAEELRNGRLSRSRRRRIVGYGTQLGLSAVQIGRLVAACREEASKSDDKSERTYALRLVDPPPAPISTPIKIALVVAAAILVDLAVFNWLW